VKPVEETKEVIKMETDTKDDHDDATAKIPNDESTSATTMGPIIDDIPKVQRKRKWFNNESQKIVSTTQIVSISSDTLKVSSQSDCPAKHRFRLILILPILSL
jgi:hypothetical protein